MTYSQKALLKQMLFLVVLLLAILLSVTLYRRHQAAVAAEEAAAQEQASIITPQQQGYTQLTYDNGSATLSFSMNEDGDWIWTDEPSFPLDDSTVRRIISELDTLKPQQTITNGDTLEAYGLDAPSATLTAVDLSKNTTLTLRFGKATTNGDSRYLLMNEDKDTVYIVADTLYNELTTPVFEMCRLPEFPELTTDNLQEITISGGVSTTITAVHPEPTDDAEDADNDTPAVTWEADGVDQSNNETVLNLLGELKDLTFSKCIDYQPAAEATALCGFDAPLCTLTVFYGNQEEPMTLTIANATMDKSGYCARLNDDATIYQIDSDVVSTILQIAKNGL